MEILTRVDDLNCIPTRAHTTDAGLDLKALEMCRLIPGEVVIVDTGVSVQIPPGFVGLVFAKSGLASKHKVSLANSVGVIDSDYRGNIKVALVNRGIKHYDLQTYEKIAQLVVVPIVLAEPKVVTLEDEEWINTKRGGHGFGSTGKL